MRYCYSVLKPVLACFFSASFTCASAEGLDSLLADYQKARAEGRISNVFNIDNDTLLLNRDDGFYTSGVRYTRLYTLDNAGGITSYGWRIGQDIYTASDINLPPERVRPPNRPYAGWLYGGFLKDVHRPDGTHVRFGVDIGCLGPCSGAEWAQTTLHDLLNQPEPQAWSKQVRNEFGVVLHGEVTPVRWALGRSVDVAPTLHGRFGNIFTDIGAGLAVRAGRLNALPDRDTFHAFLRVNAKAVGYNATLQGGYFSSGNPHTVDPKRGVGAAEAGIAWTRAPYGIRVSIARQGNEIRDLPNSQGAQNYVRLQFSYTPR